MHERRRHRRPSPQREELLALVQGLQSAIFHIDQALSLIGCSKTTAARRFANGELMRLIGEAERVGNQIPTRILQYVMAAKGIDATDKKLSARVLFSAKDCRKRMVLGTSSRQKAEHEQYQPQPEA